MLKAVGKRIIVIPVEVDTGKLIIKNSRPTQFNVISIGEDVSKVAVGNIVYLDKFAGAELEHNKEKFFVIDESQILAKLD